MKHENITIALYVIVCAYRHGLISNGIGHRGRETGVNVLCDGAEDHNREHYEKQHHYGTSVRNQARRQRLYRTLSDSTIVFVPALVFDLEATYVRNITHTGE